ncbi:MAG: sulfatase [Planctomycetota bacterium]
MPMRRFALCALLLIALAGCGPSPVVPVQPPAPPQFNGTPVVLITIDTLRVDRVGCFAPHDPYLTTPTLDALAARGTIFTQCYTTAPLTLPAHASILTGLYPPAHRIRDNVNYLLPAGATTVAEVLRDAGYDTAAFVSSPTVAAGLGLAQGFAHYDDELTLARSQGVLLAERRSDETVSRALDWLRARCDAARTAPARPFMLWLHVFDPHMPYTPPEDLRDPSRRRPPAMPPGMDADAMRVAQHIAFYDAEVTYADHQIGRLIDYLDSQELLAKSALIVTADHGEALGEHGEATHGYTCYPPTVHVPLIAAGPGVRAGASVPDAVSVTAIAPTLLQLAGVPNGALQPQSTALPLNGDDSPARTPTFEAYLGTLNFGWAPVRGAVALHDNPPRAVVWSNPPEAYDPTDDAAWTTNLWTDGGADSQQAWRDRLQALRREQAATDVGNPVVPPRTTTDTGINLASYPGAPRQQSAGESVLDAVLATTLPAQLFSPDLTATLSGARSPSAHRDDLVEYQLAQRHTAAGKYPLARQEAGRLLERDPHNAPALLLVTECWRLEAAELATSGSPREAILRAGAQAADAYARYVQCMLAAGHDQSPAVARALAESLAVRRFFAGDLAATQQTLAPFAPATLGADARLVLALCWHYAGATALARRLVEDAGDAATPALRALGEFLATPGCSRDIAVVNPRFGFP